MEVLGFGVGIGEGGGMFDKVGFRRGLHRYRYRW